MSEVKSDKLTPNVKILLCHPKKLGYGVSTKVIHCLFSIIQVYHKYIHIFKIQKAMKVFKQGVGFSGIEGGQPEVRDLQQTNKCKL